MEPVVVVAQRSSLLFLLLLGLHTLAHGDTAGDIRSRSLTPAQVGKRTRNIWQAPRTRKKSTWSYNPGHRSLAFLVAGEVETMTPNPKETEATEEFRCLDYYGAVEIPAGGSAAGVNKGGGERTAGNQPPHPVQTPRNEPNPCAQGPRRPDLTPESDSSSEEGQ
ncbi:uncharacterized protein XB22065625.L isoform X3 [Xenopus laevis]|uniref:Uncharacterized protein XB22065625.L isoform X3 n=1 Tax=Xenopus laevis TaxID=8355 RepID=A0A8J1KZE4_XENLA|nr:uncharacterized protein XB22065625.L isoform X3 [Xenopus laevis]